MTIFEQAVMQALAEISASLKSHHEAIMQCQETLLNHRDTISTLCKNAETDTEFFKKIGERFLNDEKVIENLVNALVAGNILKRDKPKQDTIN